MPRSRPASSPLSHHKLTGQYYVTRGGKRIYLSAAREEALQKYHRFALGLPKPEAAARTPSLSAKELAHRFLTAQQANWKNPDTTLTSYRDWIGRFLKDHPGQRAEDFAVEKFAALEYFFAAEGFLSRVDQPLLDCSPKHVRLRRGNRNPGKVSEAQESEV